MLDVVEGVHADDYSREGHNVLGMKIGCEPKYCAEQQTDNYWRCSIDSMMSNFIESIISGTVNVFVCNNCNLVSF